MSCSEQDRQYEAGEWPPIRGADLIMAERNRQIGREGWTAEHDDEHKNGEMAYAAICYAAPEPIFVQSDGNSSVVFSDPWPLAWDDDFDKRKQHDRIRQLVIAGALIAAEIDRLRRVSDRGAGAP